MTPLVYEDSYIRRILQEVKTIAMVGASAAEMRPSYFAMLYLQGKGYRVLPVNPRYAGKTILGETVYPDLASLPLKPDMAQIFRRSSRSTSRGSGTCIPAGTTSSGRTWTTLRS